MKLYVCECGTPLDVDDGSLCVSCFVKDHAKKPQPDLTDLGKIKEWLTDPKVGDFFEAVKKEIVFQRASWDELDKIKTSAHWFWLVAHLSSKALNSQDPIKRAHHQVTASACLYLWLESERS